MILPTKGARKTRLEMEAVDTHFGYRRSRASMVSEFPSRAW